MSARGYFGVACYHPKTTDNVGTLWRTAHVLGASFLSVIGHRYRRQPSDVFNSTRHVPLFEHDTFETFFATLPKGAQLIAVEIGEGSRSLPDYGHPEAAVYLLGPEDGSLPAPIIARCRSLVQIPGTNCLNLAVAGSIVMYDRVAKGVERRALGKVA